jgi:dTDP-4-dehydrorhamnose 3,5-epimerase
MLLAAVAAFLSLLISGRQPKMQFQPTALTNVWLVELEPICDQRGSFSRTFCVHEFSAHGLETNFPQHSVSMSARRGTLRGLHYQREPYGEAKVVRCLRGTIWDVIVDIRPGSPTFRRWQGIELSGDNGRQLYVPKGVAHGYQTLTDDVEVNYMISNFYVAEAAAGLRYDDPAFRIEWPLPISVISDKDRRWPDFAA